MHRGNWSTAAQNIAKKFARVLAPHLLSTHKRMGANASAILGQGARATIKHNRCELFLHRVCHTHAHMDPKVRVHIVKDHFRDDQTARVHRLVLLLTGWSGGSRRLLLSEQCSVVGNACGLWSACLLCGGLM
jgi:hypothetical protein